MSEITTAGFILAMLATSYYLGFQANKLSMDDKAKLQAAKASKIIWLPVVLLVVAGLLLINFLASYINLKDIPTIIPLLIASISIMATPHLSLYYRLNRVHISHDYLHALLLATGMRVFIVTTFTLVRF